jgi:hypothetical protein
MKTKILLVAVADCSKQRKAQTSVKEVSFAGNGQLWMSSTHFSSIPVHHMQYSSKLQGTQVSGVWQAVMSTKQMGLST